MVNHGRVLLQSSWHHLSLVALKVLPLGGFRSGAMRSNLLHCGGGTDNKAAGSSSVRKLSTKLPVMVALMELLSLPCSSMCSCGCR